MPAASFQGSNIPHHHFFWLPLPTSENLRGQILPLTREIAGLFWGGSVQGNQWLKNASAPVQDFLFWRKNAETLNTSSNNALHARLKKNARSMRAKAPAKWVASDKIWDLTWRSHPKDFFNTLKWRVVSCTCILYGCFFWGGSGFPYLTKPFDEKNPWCSCGRREQGTIP